MRVVSLVCATVSIAVVAGAEVANLVEYPPCMVGDEIDPFTDEHENTLLVCQTTPPAAGIAVFCETEGRTVMLDVGGYVADDAVVRLRVGTGDVHDMGWQNPAGYPAQIIEPDDADGMALVEELIAQASRPASAFCSRRGGRLPVDVR